MISEEFYWLTNIEYLFYCTLQKIGYLLSNALNSGDKSGEKAVEEAATTLAVSEATTAVNEAVAFAATTLSAESNTASTNVENSSQVETSSVEAILSSEQTTQIAVTETTNKASTIQLTTYYYIFASILSFIKIVTWIESHAYVLYVEALLSWFKMFTIFIYLIHYHLEKC